MVLLHGFNANGAMWGPVAERLRTGGRSVHVVDLRGHGRSSPLEVSTTVEHNASDVALVLTALDLSDVVLAGHSLGGMILQAFAAADPELLASRVRGFALVNTSGNPTGSRATRLTGALLQSRLLDVLTRTQQRRMRLARQAFPTPTPEAMIRLQASMVPPALASRRNFVVSSVQELADSIPGARLRLLAGTGHLLPLERPEVVAQEVLRLVASPR